MDLTILIPTRNRFEYLKKIISYYQNFNFSGKIFLIDSSEYSTFQKTKNFLKKNNNRQIKHFRVIGRPFECIKSINSKIKTKFVCFSGDDDYYIVSGLANSIKILKKNKKIDAINGLSIAAKIKKQEKLSINYSIYNNYYSTLKNSTQRVIKILKNYQVPLFSIFRTNLFKKVITNVPDKSNRSLCPTRIIHDEILESLLFVYFNKIYNYKFPYLVRTIPHKKYAKTSIDNLFKSNHLSKNHRKSLLFVYRSIYKHIKNNNERKSFSKEFQIFVNQIQHVNSKYHNYLKAVKMQIDKLYKRITCKNFNTFYKVLNWLGKN